MRFFRYPSGVPRLVPILLVMYSTGFGGLAVAEFIGPAVARTLSSTVLLVGLSLLIDLWLEDHYDRSARRGLVALLRHVDPRR